MNAAHFTSNWNRSFVLMPDGAPRGAVVLLHGLTDSPYSLRHIAARYREQGFVAVAIRLPGHGTVPAGLTTVRDEDWRAATRLAVRTARALAKTGPLHIVGYSNGGALALNTRSTRSRTTNSRAPDQLVLISPMIGITSFARFAGVLGWPAVFPAVREGRVARRAARVQPVQVQLVPVNAARQSSQVANGVREQLLELAADGRLAQTTADPHVPVRARFDRARRSAVIDTLYVHLPQNGSELVLFDRNRNAEVRALMRPENADLAHDAAACAAAQIRRDARDELDDQCGGRGGADRRGR